MPTLSLLCCPPRHQHLCAGRLGNDAADGLSGRTRLHSIRRPHARLGSRTFCPGSRVARPRALPASPVCGCAFGCQPPWSAAPPLEDGCSRSSLIRTPRPTVRLNPRVCTYGTIWPGLLGPARRAGPNIVSAARLSRPRARRRQLGPARLIGLVRACLARPRLPPARARPATGPRRDPGLGHGGHARSRPLRAGTFWQSLRPWRGHRWSKRHERRAGTPADVFCAGDAGNGPCVAPCHPWWGRLRRCGLVPTWHRMLNTHTTPTRPAP